jgi:hypothetical protein
VCFRFPNNDILQIKLTRETAYRFVSRLNIRKTNQQLADTIDRYVVQELRSVIKVRLRNAHIRYNDIKIKLLCDFIKKIGHTASDCLDVMLNIIEEPHAEADLMAALERRRDFYMLALQKAEESEEQLGKNNIETLMVQGVRLPHIDRNEVMRQIAMIEKILYFLSK